MKKNIIVFLIFILTFTLIGCTTTETFNVTKLEVSNDTIEICVGDIDFLQIEYDGNKLYTDLDIINNNPDIIAVTKDEITGLSTGIATITITAKNDNNLSVTVTVYVNSTDYKKSFIRVSSPTNGLAVGKSMEVYVDNLKSLNASGNGDFIFSVSDPEVLKLNDDYTVTALKNGVCSVYAREIKNPSNVGELIVYVGNQSTDKTSSNEPENTPLIAYFEDNNYTIDANVDEQIIIEGAVDYQRYRYTSSDENILLVSDTGKFMGVKEGEVEVVILSKDSTSGFTNTTLKIKVTGERKRDYIPILIQIALAEEGYREWTNSNDTKYGEWNNCNYENWCATFVSWCLNNAGVPKSIAIRSISVRVYETTYRSRNQFYLKGEYQPVAGDLIIFSSAGASHIGIVVRSDDQYVYTIEGNTSNMVAQRVYRLDYETITGYIKPNYDE